MTEQKTSEQIMREALEKALRVLENTLELWDILVKKDVPDHVAKNAISSAIGISNKALRQSSEVPKPEIDFSKFDEVVIDSTHFQYLEDAYYIKDKAHELIKIKKGG